uniref:Uncharacterized protein n=1 Tax=Zea mays TaxID=4577 RepID=B6U396_MAIZE|nr:hypothetical protein [Zea mays]
MVHVVSRARKLAGETNCLPVIGRILTGNPRAALQRRPAASSSSRVREDTCHPKSKLVPGISSPRSRAGTTG